MKIAVIGGGAAGLMAAWAAADAGASVTLFEKNEKCGKKIEFVNDAIEQLQEKVCRVHDFIPTSHHMVLYGICADCRKKA